MQYSRVGESDSGAGERAQAVAMQDQEGIRERMPPSRPLREPPRAGVALDSRSTTSAAFTMARHLSKASSMPHAAWMALSLAQVTASPCTSVGWMNE